MGDTSDKQLVALNEAIVRDFPGGVDPGWPGGWPGQVEAALIDAVFSIRAKYGGPTTGVRGVVQRWREANSGRALDDLEVLAKPSGPSLVDVAENDSKTGGQLKSVAVMTAAAAMVEAEVRHASDLKDAKKRAGAKQAYLGVRGLGHVTWSYFLMLNGVHDVKADTHVVAWVNQQMPDGSSRLGTSEVRDLLHDATHDFDNLTNLDHAIWRKQSGRT